MNIKLAGAVTYSLTCIQLSVVAIVNSVVPFGSRLALVQECFQVTVKSPTGLIRATFTLPP